MTHPVEGSESTPAVTSLEYDACWQVLKRLEFGRLAYAINGRIDLVPVNYAVHAGEVVFRTAQGSKLAGVLQGGEVVFEVDEVTSTQATSVIVRATPREFPPNEARWADQMRLRPWVATRKEHVIGLRPIDLSGRSFALTRPWTMMRPPR
ncbi:hypothetical protein KEM60_03103 [Austwickia sp. TVS 96-490-7B]|uniref:pyridoxamine 5'-phosphate oxidase family protein n=1 Tax=Austwickia sp. TVS 96-490-7B TaxID=2830843 RepID=UPI001C59ECAA|nr:pyridoxamine 5'-phosphate oxidase family protein [Austwickia sp. TVS 96-490-7B]MBW3086874.1 hypothetical protein [Austwickia sp. TVS 96-490-7B]